MRHSPQGCRHVLSASPEPADERLHRPPDHRANATSCMFKAPASASRVRLPSSEQLLEDAGQELNACLPLPRADQRRAADLVQDGRGALLERWVDDVPFQRVDRLRVRSAGRPDETARTRGFPPIAAASARSTLASRDMSSRRADGGRLR